MSWDPVWEQVFSSQAWGRYPGEDLAKVRAAAIVHHEHVVERFSGQCMDYVHETVRRPIGGNQDRDAVSLCAQHSGWETSTTAWGYR